MKIVQHREWKRSNTNGENYKTNKTSKAWLQKSNEKEIKFIKHSKNIEKGTSIRA